MGNSLSPCCFSSCCSRSEPDLRIGQSGKSKGGILYQLKNGCNWEDLPKDLPPYSTVYWHYKQWRAAGVIEQLMSVLHEQVREQVKKNRSGQH
jgi:transposase